MCTASLLSPHQIGKNVTKGWRTNSCGTLWNQGGARTCALLSFGWRNWAEPPAIREQRKLGVACAGEWWWGASICSFFIGSAISLCLPGHLVLVILAVTFLPVVHGCKESGGDGSTLPALVGTSAVACNFSPRSAWLTPFVCVIYVFFFFCSLQ